MIIGAQMYTLRDFCKDTDSLAETLKKIADIGYETVQVSGTCEYDADWLKRELDKNGLKCVITHIPTVKLETELDNVIKNHDILDCKYIGLGVFDFEEDKGILQEFKDKYLPIAKQIKENNKYFMYHNHNKEFRKYDGVRVFDSLAEMFSPEYMGFTFDTYWGQVSGADPADMIAKLNGRVPCIHLKDCAFDGKMAVVGEGNINFDRVFSEAEKSGTEYMLVEQDDCYGEDPFECLKRSYKYLKSCGF